MTLRPPKPVRNPALGSAKSKLDRAHEHITALDGEARRFYQTHPDAVTLGFREDPNPQLIPVIVAALEDLPPVISTILGDTLHNFRDTLDHIAWQVVDHGGKPLRKLSAEAQTEIKFPIVSGPSRAGDPPATYFQNGCRSAWLPGIRPEHLTIIERFQPYKRGNLADEHPFTLLQELSNTDKHRNIHTIHAAAAHFGLRVVSQPIGCLVYGLKLGPGLPGPLRVGAEVGYISVADKALCDHMTVEPNAQVAIALEDGRGIGITLEVIGNLLADLLAEIDAVL